MWDEKTFVLFSSLSDLQISKNGEFIVYNITKANYESNDYKKTIIIKDLREGSESYIENSYNPTLSKDGKFLAYVKENKRKKLTEVWICELKNLSRRKLLEIKNFIDLVWLKDDKEILVITYERLGDEDLYFESKIPFWFDGRGILDSEKTNFSIYELNSGNKLESFTQDFFVLPYFTVAIAHQDGFIINIPKRENPYIKYDILEYSNGSLDYLYRDVSFTAIDSNDREILFLGKPKKSSITEHDYLYKYSNGDLEPITENFKWNNYDGKIISSGEIYFTSAVKGKIVLDKFKESKETLVDENCYVLDFDVSEDGKVVFVKQTSTVPDEIFFFDGRIKQITNYNTRIIKKIGSIEPIYFNYKSFDGKLIDAWYLKPKELKGTCPIIVMVHGGPKGMYGYQFIYQAQLLANNGYYVLLTNPRGSDGYEEEFAKDVVQKTGLEDFQDILYGLTNLFEKEKEVDKNKVGITGISYGGFMTNWAIGKSNIFKAAISENGISYWLSDYGFSDIGYWFDKELIGENPLENENYKKLSPLSYVNNVNTPVLFIHSTEDYRCTFDQSLIFYTLLKDLGKEAYIALFKSGAHAHSLNAKPRHRAKRYKLILEFFRQKLIENKIGFDINFLKEFKD